MASWDWYQATVHDREPAEVIGVLLHELDLASVRPCKPLNGYQRGDELHRGDVQLARCMYGGNPGVHVLATGQHSPEVAHVLKASFPGHRVTRADACEDWVEAGLFDRLSAMLRRAALDLGITINMQGDWERGQARTLYLGSRQGTAQLVLYEKGYEAGGDPNWVRLEVRVRPDRTEGGQLVGTWANPAQCFQAAQWLVKVLERIGWDHLQAEAVRRPYSPTEAQRARLACIRCYGAILESWASEVGGWDSLGPVMGQALGDLRVERERARDLLAA